MDIDFTVIIVNWNGEQFIGKCLRSIREEAAGLSLQTILVDNASKDRSVRIIRDDFPDVELIESDRNLGFAGANNLALRQARGEFVMYLNPDASILPGTLMTICNYLRNHRDVGAVGCQMLNEHGEVQPLMPQTFPTPFSEFVRLFQEGSRILALFGLEPVMHDPVISGSVVKISGGCLTARRAILDRLHGFDERFFMYCEDGELCQRIAQAGWKLRYLAEAAVMHLQGSSSRKAPKGFSTLMQCESFSKYMGKRFGRFGSLRYRGLMLLGSGIRLLLSSLMLALKNISRSPAAPLWRRRLDKNLLIFRWSAGVARPTIPD